MKRKLLLLFPLLVATFLFGDSVDLSNWVLHQFNSTQNYTIPDGTVLEPNEMLVIGRDSEQAAFETEWGVTLGTNVTYLNSGNRVPQINGSETYSLENSTGTTIDSESNTGSDISGNLLYRPDTSVNSWSIDSSGTVLPGTLTNITLTQSGVRIVICADCAGTGKYVYEFIQIVNDSLILPESPSSFSAAATSSTTIDLSWLLNGSSDPVIVARKEGSAISASPQNGSIYNVSDTFSDGSTVIYKGTGTSLQDTGLTASNTYYYRVYSYDGDTVYSNPQSASETTPAIPIADYSLSYNGDDYTSGATVTTLAQELPCSDQLLFTVENPGTANLEISAISLTNGTNFSLVNKPAQMISAGKSSTFSMAVSAATAGGYNDTLEIVTNIGTKTHPISVSVQSTVSIPAPGSTLTFADTTSGYKSPIKSVYIYNNEETTLSITTVSLSNTTQFERADNLGASFDLEKGECAQLRFRFIPDSAAAFNSTLTLYHNGSLKSYTLSGTGKERPEIRVTKEGSNPKITVVNRVEGTFEVYRNEDLSNSSWTSITTLNDQVNYTDTGIDISSKDQCFYKVVEVDDPWADYYTGVEGLTDEALLSRLRTITSSPYDQMGYDSRKTDLYWDIDVEDGTIRTVYTTTSYSQSTEGANTPTGLSAEHSWPQSYGADSEPNRSDFHHLFACEATVNSRRGNHYFGTVANASWTQDGTKYGTDSSGTTVFEVRLQDRGDIARGMFYFAMRFDFDMRTQAQGWVDDAVAEEMGFEDVLRQWHEDDPVDAWERARNDKIHNDYNLNRNPFVDHPEYVDRISDF